MAKSKKQKSSTDSFTWRIAKVMLKPVFYLLKTLCLWLPVIYIAFGYGLSVTFDFNPLAMDTNSIIYLVGLGISILVALVFFAQKKRKEKAKIKAKVQQAQAEQEDEPAPKPRKWNANRKTAQPVKEEYQEPPRQYKSSTYEPSRYQESASTYEPPKYQEQSRYQAPQSQCEQPRYQEVPQVYFSTNEENTLIHEYNNRFEVFRLVNGERKISEVLFKDDIK